MKKMSKKMHAEMMKADMPMGKGKAMPYVKEKGKKPMKKKK